MFIVWDIYDGKLARRFTVDYPLRRMADAYTDRAFIAVTVSSLTVQDARWAPILISLVARDAALWSVLRDVFIKRHACLLGGAPNRQAAWTWAVWVVAAFWFGPTWWTLVLGIASSLVNFLVLANMYAFGRTAVCDPPRALVVDSWRLRRRVGGSGDCPAAPADSPMWPARATTQ